MWTALLTEGAVAPVADAAGGSPVALIITAACGGIAAIITAVSLLIRARDRDDDPPAAPDPAPVGGRPLGERVAVVEHELEDVARDLAELRGIVLGTRPARTVPTPRRSLL